MIGHKAGVCFFITYIGFSSCHFQSKLLNLNDTPEFPRNPNLATRSCQALGQHPHFDADAVVGKPWRIYFTWHNDLREKCVDIHFRKATPEIESRFYTDMNEYLDMQPRWGFATLVLTMGRPDHQMLLFPDEQRPHGSYLGVINMVQEGISVQMRTVPLLSIMFRLMDRDRFLAIADCGIGIACLAARFDQPVFRQEVVAAALKIEIDNGAMACLRDKNVNENIIHPEH